MDYSLLKNCLKLHLNRPSCVCFGFKQCELPLLNYFLEVVKCAERAIWMESEEVYSQNKKGV